MKQVLLILTIFILNQFTSGAQDACIVKLKDVQGTYTGDCEKGKANGKGKSIGTDTYEGEFKDGYPEGKGMYTWKDGHYFVGFFKKGNKEGKGDMYYESAAGTDSVISGYWKKDKYYGEYEKQYVVITSSGRVNKVDCSLTDEKGDNLFFTVHQKTSSTNSGAPISVAFITNIVTIKGNFYTSTRQLLSNSSLTKVQQVIFPFRAIFNFSTGESTEIEFNTKGSYDIYIDLQ